MSPQGNSSRWFPTAAGRAGVLALALLAVFAMPGVALGANGSISGTVTAASGGSVLEGIEVCAWEVPSEAFSCTTTDAFGEYTISALPVGNYKVEFWPGDGSGYLIQFYDSKSSWEEADQIAVMSGDDTPGVDAALEDAGRISGTVTDAAGGAAIKSSTVCAVEALSAEVWSCVLTGGDGGYILGGLQAGSYKVWFSPDEPESGEDDYFEQYYSNSKTLAQATAITVAAPGLVSGIDAHLISRKARPSLPVVTAPVLPVVLPAPVAPKPKAKSKCPKGKRLVKHKGKKRCVKVHRGRHAGASRRVSSSGPQLP